MNTAVLSSTFFLTLLLAIGLFFFIRASVKERIEEIQLFTEETRESLLEKLQTYFDRRAYKVTASESDRLTFEGFVRPSWFLAIFLSVLAAIGLLSLALVFAYLFPAIGNFFIGLVIIAPLAGYFYWKGAGRVEQVLIKIETEATNKNRILVRGHRDELIQLKRTFPFATQ
ncbi:MULTISPECIES: cofactor assembly of complex C subunit B [Spirulina sp. CCY15215]|uniref:cofactor assembly of complex C subunit B n=1 Tax=Spirulina sp. CCY15215 TaxID=2767591 RepID=UPI001950089C|nr:cofactor assembly of complex C subunit B [Spirulina major]